MNLPRHRLHQAERERTRQPRKPDPVSRPPQFSLRNLLIANSMIAVCLALLQIFAPSSVAGVLGAATLAFGLASVKLRDEWPLIERIWWVLLGLYLLSCAAAVLIG